MTQNERVLRALRTAGLHGISQPQFDNPSDGKPIRRLAARILDLKQQGYEIHADNSGSMAVYTLIRDPEMGRKTHPEKGRRVAAGHSPEPSHLGAAPGEVHPSASPGTGSSPSEALSHPSVEPVPLFDDEPQRRGSGAYRMDEAA